VHVSGPRLYVAVCLPCTCSRIAVHPSSSSRLPVSSFPIQLLDVNRSRHQKKEKAEESLPMPSALLSYFPCSLHAAASSSQTLPTLHFPELHHQQIGWSSRAVDGSTIVTPPSLATLLPSASSSASASPSMLGHLRLTHDHQSRIQHTSVRALATAERDSEKKPSQNSPYPARTA
jgi:hypothetical protein